MNPAVQIVAQGAEGGIDATALQAVPAQPVVLRRLQRLGAGVGGGHVLLDRHAAQQVHDPLGVVLGAAALGRLADAPDRRASAGELRPANPQEGLDGRRVVGRRQVVAGHRY
jgi:hypothetical protein